MPHPHRFEIYIRPGAGRRPTLECSLNEGRSWSDTKLSSDTIYEGYRAETLEQLLANLATIGQIEEIERSLPYQRQKRIGRMLFSGLFGARAPKFIAKRLHLIPSLSDDGDPETERIRDEFFDLFLRLPWTLLTDENSDAAQFLALREPSRCAISIDAAPTKDGTPRFPEVKLPLHPRVLLICPIGEGGGRTDGKRHSADLEAILKASYPPSFADRIRTVHTFGEFTKSLNERPRFNPHIIYFYGHAEAQERDTILRFDPADGHDGLRRIDEFRYALDSLRARTNFPPVIWINACKSASAKQNSALRSLAPIASAVIATRTLAVVDDSQELGCHGLRSIAIDGKPPPIALSEAMSLLALGRAEVVKSARWATTIVAVQYGFWSPLRTEDRNLTDMESVGDIPMRLDRAVPLDGIKTFLIEALQSNTEKPKAPHAILWYGSADDSTEVFEQRLFDFVSETFDNWSLVSYDVEIQPSALQKDDLDNYFRDCIYSGLNRAPGGEFIGALDSDITQALLPYMDETLTFVVLSHGPFGRCDVELVRRYLSFWENIFPALHLDPSRTRILLGLRFVREDSSSMFGADERAFIQELGPVPSDELAGHLKRYYQFYGVREDRTDDEAEELIETNGASFRRLHAALEKKLRFKWWSDRAPETRRDQ